MAAANENTPAQAPAQVSPSVLDSGKNQVAHVEECPNEDEQFQKMPKIEKVDEFGAHTKTDPKEIALVRKLDWYILVG